jgi:hypothetical protein
MDYHRSLPGGQGGLARDMRGGAAMEVYALAGRAFTNRKHSKC